MKSNPILFLTVCIFLFSGTSLYAQKFHPDAGGYVSSPKFPKYIAAQGYEAVGVFDTISENPLVIAAPILKGEHAYYIGTDGKIIPDLKPDLATTFYGEVKLNLRSEKSDRKKWGNHYKYIDSCLEISQNGKTGLQDQHRNWIIEPLYDYLRWQPAFKVAIVGNGGLSNTKYGIADGQGIRIPIDYDGIDYLAPGLCRTQRNSEKDKRFGLIDLRTCTEKQTAVWASIGPFHSGMARIELDAETYSLYGFVDTTGHVSIVPIYTYADAAFKSGMAVVGIRDKYGVIDQSGNLLIPARYEKLELIQQYDREIQKDKHSANAVVAGENKKVGVLSLSGKQITAIIYDGVKPVANGFLVHKDGLYGLLGPDGKIRIPMEYDHIGVMGYGFFSGTKAEKNYRIDAYGNAVFQQPGYIDCFGLQN